jgi:hypothetical protein
MESKLRIIFKLNKLLKLFFVILSLFLPLLIIFTERSKGYCEVKYTTDYCIQNNNNLTQYAIGVLLFSVLSVVVLLHHILPVLIALPLLYNHLVSSNCTATFLQLRIVDFLAGGFILKIQ